MSTSSVNLILQWMSWYNYTKYWITYKERLWRSTAVIVQALASMGSLSFQRDLGDIFILTQPNGESYFAGNEGENSPLAKPANWKLYNVAGSCYWLCVRVWKLNPQSNGGAMHIRQKKLILNQNAAFLLGFVSFRFSTCKCFQSVLKKYQVPVPNPTRSIVTHSGRSIMLYGYNLRLSFVFFFQSSELNLI